MRTLQHALIPALALVAVMVCAATCLALTVDVEVTPAWVREHPQEFSVDVSQKDDGLIHFKIVHTVAVPKYHVAHLAVYHQGKLISKSDTPAFGRKGGNTFHVALLPEDLSASKFELSDSALAGDGENAVPVPGTINHRIPLADFVPAEMLKTK